MYAAIPCAAVRQCSLGGGKGPGEGEWGWPLSFPVLCVHTGCVPRGRHLSWFRMCARLPRRSKQQRLKKKRQSPHGPSVYVVLVRAKIVVVVKAG